MKFQIVFISLITLSVTACNFSLAGDITPPPDYVSPTPPSDLGVLYPEETPSSVRGAEFFIESCASCHGETGLGNGPMAASMPIAVPAIGLRAISSQVAPADRYKTITLGNTDRGMPSFAGHSSQDRWDVIAYLSALNTTPEELQRGAEVYANSCTECHGSNGNANPAIDFTNQEYMSKVSDNSLYRGIAEGKGEMKSFASELPEIDIWAVTAYLRSLSFDLTPSEPASTETAESSLIPESTPRATLEGTPEGELQTVETPGPLTVTLKGFVTNASGTGLQSGLSAIAVLYNTTDGQTLDSLTTDVGIDGSFTFHDLYADSQIAYWISVDYQGVSYFSDVAVFDGSTQELNMHIIVYDATTDWTTLSFDLVHIGLAFSADSVQVSELYVINNPSLLTVVISTDGSSLPFIELPKGVTELTGLSPDSRGAAFLPASEGIALPPVSDAQYGVIASFSIPYDRRLIFEQNFPMSITSMSLFVPEGINIKTDQLGDSGTQNFGGTVYHLYESTNLPAGLLTFIVSGTQRGNVSVGLDQRTWLVIGAGGLGVIFVGLGIFLFLRDRSLAKKEETEDVLTDDLEGDTSENDLDALADAIIAIDEKFKRGEIAEDVHEKRRAELKAKLKELM
jgi:mono/diheme cytochrome c family protein